METYQSEIANNKKVALIHLSQDDDKKDATTWAKSNLFPWPTILKSKQRSSGLLSYAGRFIPNYVLIDKNGELLAEGKSASLKKLKELSQPAEDSPQ